MTVHQLPSDDPPVFSGGYQVLASIAKSIGYNVTAQQLIHQMGKGRRSPTTDDLMRAAARIGLRVRLVRAPSEQKLRSLPVPAMIKLKDGSWQSYRGEIGGGLFRLVDPIERRTSDLPLDELVGRFGGEVMLIGKSFGHAAEDLGFGLSWFMPLIKRYKRPIIEMLVVSFFVNLLALGYPLGVSARHRQGSAAQELFDADRGDVARWCCWRCSRRFSSYLRQYLLQHTANRIDVELGAKLYSHLLHLPISYFESRAAGVIVTRARELRIDPRISDRAGAAHVDRSALHLHLFRGPVHLFVDIDLRGAGDSAALHRDRRSSSGRCYAAC